MTHLHTILVPVDFSSESRIAVRRARDIAFIYGTRVCLLHVTSMPSVPAWAPDLGYTLQRMHDDTRTRAQFALAAIIDQERLDTKTTSAVVLTGRPADVIPLYADEIDADLIVMGLHTGTRILGHVTDRVMRAVRCPVLTIPARDSEETVIGRHLEAELAC